MNHSDNSYTPLLYEKKLIDDVPGGFLTPADVMRWPVSQ